MDLKDTTLLMIEEGAFKGRRMLLSKEDMNKEVHYANVENGSLFGIPKFSVACLIHEEFVSSSGCLKCKEEIESQAPEV